MHFFEFIQRDIVISSLTRVYEFPRESQQQQELLARGQHRGQRVSASGSGS
jgi:hypothetical protein